MFHYFFNTAVFVTVIASSSAIAQSRAADADTLHEKPAEHSYVLPEFVISATRWEVRVEDLASSAIVLTPADLEAKNGSALSATMEGLPGIFMKSYGGPGSVSTSSLRGMGAEHTLVLIDGQRYNNVRDGQVDFGTFLLQNIERIEVLRGGFSSTYGADALGGIINIITKRPDGGSHLTGEASAGSYAMNGQRLGGEFKLGVVSLQCSAIREAGSGEYAFDFSDGVTSRVLRRQNADYVNAQVQLLADFPLGSDLAIRLSNMYNSSDRGSPAAVLSPTSSNRARLRDGGILTQAVIEWTTLPSLSVRISTLYNAQRRQYLDPLASGGPDDQQSDYRDQTIVLTPQLRDVLNSQTTLILGGEFSHSTISSNLIASAIRSQESVFLSSDHVFERAGELFHQLNLYPSIRYDHFSDVAGSLDPKIGINVGLWRSGGVRLRSSYGLSFRAPTFYDLYWKNGGNPNLLPERSRSFDAGVTLTSDVARPFEAEINYFDIRTTNRIVWTPDNNGLWSPKNLQKVNSNGLELIASVHLLQNQVTIRGSYTDSDTRKVSSVSPDDQTVNKQLPYLPHEMASLSASINISRANLNVQHSFSGYRFATETNDPQFVLSGYQITDANLTIRLTDHPVSTEIRFEASNIFNTSYVIFPNYPMPLRTFALKLHLEY